MVTPTLREAKSKKLHRNLLIVPWLDAQMAQLAQGEVEVDAAVSVVEPGSTKAKRKRAGRPKIDRQSSGRQGGKDSGVSNEREERRVVSRMTGRKTEELRISPPRLAVRATHGISFFFFPFVNISSRVHKRNSSRRE